MARQPRFFVPGEVLHVIQRGNNHEPIFAGEEDYRCFLDCLVQASRRHGVLIHAGVRAHVEPPPPARHTPAEGGPAQGYAVRGEALRKLGTD